MKITVTYEIDVNLDLVRRCLLERDRYDAHGDPEDDGAFDEIPEDDDLDADVDEELLNEIRSQSSPSDIWSAPELEGVRFIHESGVPIR